MGGDGKPHNRYFTHKREIYGIDGLKTAEQVKAEMPELLEDWKKVEEINARRASSRAQAAA